MMKQECLKKNISEKINQGKEDTKALLLFCIEGLEAFMSIDPETR